MKKNFAAKNAKNAKNAENEPTLPDFAYRLGAAACVLVMEKPDGWKRKLGANVREARKLGVQIDTRAFYDVALPAPGKDKP